MDAFLESSQAQIKEFNAEGLAALAWSLGALGYVPDKLWLRSLVGQVWETARLATSYMRQVLQSLCWLASVSFAI